MDWSTFYLGAAGAAATLIGLLFIAMQFNIEVLAAEPGNHWRAVARSTFNIFTTLFFLPLIFLIPALSTSDRAAASVFIIIVNIVRQIRAYLAVWRETPREERRMDRLVQLAWHLIAPLTGYVSLGYLAVALNQGHSPDGVQIGMAYALLGLFAIALRNSWNLLVEVTYEKKRSG